MRGKECPRLPFRNTPWFLQQISMTSTTDEAKPLFRNQLDAKSDSFPWARRKTILALHCS